MKQPKKRFITLLEIMIVIFLIGIIGSVIGYNIKGSLEEGRAFKTRQAQSQLKDILLLEVANQQAHLEEAVQNPRKYLASSPLVKDSESLLRDGWGEEFKLQLSKNKSDLEIFSKNLARYEEKKNRKKENAKE